MGMLPTLDIPPGQPRWATNGGTVIEPPEGTKSAGHQVAVRMAARWQNWYQNTVFEWVRRTALSLVSFWQQAPAGVLSGFPLSISYHPDIGLWVACEDDDVYYSLDQGWVLDTALTAAAMARSIGIDVNNNFLIGLSDGSIDYGDPVGGWANDTGIGAASAVATLITKYPDVAFALAGLSNGDIYIASGGVGTSWAAATTQPNFTTKVVSIIRTGSTAWIAFSGVSECSVSGDDGVNWSDTTGDPTDVNLNYMNQAAYNEETGTIICVGSQNATTVPKIARSVDGGNSWVEATVQLPEYDAGDLWKTVYHVGGGLWVAFGDQETGKQIMCVASYDDGENWYPVETDVAAVNDTIEQVACNGRVLKAVGANGFTLRSRALAGSML